MSNNYKEGKDVPNSVLADRLDELVSEIVKSDLGPEFSMRVPAEVDRDADLVMSEASVRLRGAKYVDDLLDHTSELDAASEGIAKQLGLDPENYQSFSLMFDAIARKIDAIKFELAAYREVVE